jgi:hypothetical protein
MYRIQQPRFLSTVRQPRAATYRFDCPLLFTCVTTVIMALDRSCDHLPLQSPRMAALRYPNRSTVHRPDRLVVGAAALALPHYEDDDAKLG